jgi:hypothetical protein
MSCACASDSIHSRDRSWPCSSARAAPRRRPPARVSAMPPSSFEAHRHHAGRFHATTSRATLIRRSKSLAASHSTRRDPFVPRVDQAGDHAVRLAEQRHLVHRTAETPRARRTRPACTSPARSVRPPARRRGRRPRRCSEAIASRTDLSAERRPSLSSSPALIRTSRTLHGISGRSQPASMNAAIVASRTPSRRRICTKRLLACSFDSLVVLIGIVKDSTSDLLPAEGCESWSCD